MKKVNKREPVIWGLEKWYEKVVYCIGVFVTVLWLFAFLLGVVLGLLGL